MSFHTYIFSIVYFGLWAAHGSDIHQVSLNDDPSLFPGHLEPLGSKQPQVEIETLTEYPSEKDFFKHYITPGRPFLLKNGAKNQAAFKKWTDEYMKSFPAAEKELVQVEPNLKEIRESPGFEIPLKEFIERYKKESVYMVNKVPSFLMKDVLMPAPLRCNSTRNLMLDHVTWMSSGGTKSVLHGDDLDNINCLFRGTKELLLIDPKKFGKKVPIDRPRGGYSSLDVDKVNFTKFPGMREVEYVHCKMEEGDCLFIPFRWFHQVNSAANENKQNIAVNIWFKHQANHKPEFCNVSDEDASLDKWEFPGMESLTGDGGEEGENPFPLISLFEYILSKTKYERASWKTFQSLLQKVPGIIVEEVIDHLTMTEEFNALAREIFEALNADGDKYLKSEDFQLLAKDQHKEHELERWLNSQLDKMQDILTKQLDEVGLKEETIEAGQTIIKEVKTEL
ncbi:uncharacterized protein LOC130645700 [Hydractinia symbiolongicarpus]|uniref:uncharacterized protein LOC130645700 n=1 Tax=Hydractinia symbiolongicarpus TaxID=13093 RepID=UPI00254B30C5|nr:uncharacterized protein LOC130645700 [Hydractinia symbiolongicarpus]